MKQTEGDTVSISEELVVDPHLMRLGQNLAWVERDAGWTRDDMEYLEDQFQEEPWMS